MRLRQTLNIAKHSKGTIKELRSYEKHIFKNLKNSSYEIRRNKIMNSPNFTFKHKHFSNRWKCIM